MIKNFAIVNNNAVENIILIDTDDQEIIQAFNAIEIPDDILVCIGWPYVDGTFIDPNPPAEPKIGLVPLSDEEINIMLQELRNEVTPTS